MDVSVLIVDDESINIKIVSNALRRRGYACTSLTDGTEVVDLLVTQGKRFDIILMDSMMKIMDGPDAVAAVRQHEWNTQQQHQPVLAVTASILRPDQENCFRAGYQGVIAKPIAVKAIASQVLSCQPGTCCWACSPHHVRQELRALARGLTLQTRAILRALMRARDIIKAGVEPSVFTTDCSAPALFFSFK